MEENRAYLPRGSKSRNKVSVGEPAEGSVIVFEDLVKSISSTKGKQASKQASIRELLYLGSVSILLTWCFELLIQLVHSIENRRKSDAGR